MSLFITIKKIDPYAVIGTHVPITTSPRKNEEEGRKYQIETEIAIDVANKLQKFQERQKIEARAEKLRNDPNIMQIDEYVEILLKGRSQDSIEIFDREICVDRDQFSYEEWDDLNFFCNERGILIWENCLTDH